VHVDVSNAARPRVIEHILSEIRWLDHMRFTESGGLHQPAPTNLGNALLVEPEDSGCLSGRQWHKVMFLVSKRDQYSPVQSKSITTSRRVIV